MHQGPDRWSRRFVGRITAAFGRKAGDPLSWFYRIDRATQAAVLARPHGYLPEGLAEGIGRHVDAVQSDGTPMRRQRWLLRVAEANLLEEERLRLDRWWDALSRHERDVFIACRDGRQIPHKHRPAVLELSPGAGVRRTCPDSEVSLPRIASAYIEMRVAALAPPA